MPEYNIHLSYTLPLYVNCYRINELMNYFKNNKNGCDSMTKNNIAGDHEEI